MHHIITFAYIMLPIFCHASSFATEHVAVIISYDPSNAYQELGSVKITTHQQISEKVTLAQQAFVSWSMLTITERVAILEDVYGKLVAQRDRIAALSSQEIGMPLTLCKRIDVDAGLMYLRGYLDHAQEWLSPEVTFENDTETHTLSFEGRGVASVVAAWNYPFCNFVWGVMQNLIVGNTVVFKHSEECPLMGVLLEEILNTTKLPKGVFNVVHGAGSDTGEYLMNSNIDIIHFTGSSKVGKHLYQIAAEKFIPVVLELGGSAAGIVFADANISETIESIYCNRFVNSGQVCDGLKRLIVHRSCYDTVIEGLVKILSEKHVGPANDPQTDIGPLVAERQVRTLDQQVTDALNKGAKIITGGYRPENIYGAYYQPTILTNISSDMRIWKEEVFGPVLPVVVFDTFEEAMALANDTPYGLGGYIYTQNEKLAARASRLLKTGNISVNGADYVIPSGTFGGCKMSGIGREHGKHGLRELCIVKLVATKKQPVTEPVEVIS